MFPESDVPKTGSESQQNQLIGEKEKDVSKTVPVTSKENVTPSVESKTCNSFKIPFKSEKKGQHRILSDLQVNFCYLFTKSFILSFL